MGPPPSCSSEQNLTGNCTRYSVSEKTKEIAEVIEDSISNVENEKEVAVKENKKSSSIVTSEDVYFAIPKLEGQMSCQDFCEDIIIKNNVNKDYPLMQKNIIKKIIGNSNDKYISA